VTLNLFSGSFSSVGSGGFTGSLSEQYQASLSANGPTAGFTPANLSTGQIGALSTFGNRGTIVPVTATPAATTATPDLPQETPELIIPKTHIRGTSIPIGRGKRRVNGRPIWRKGSRITSGQTNVVTQATQVVTVQINQSGPAPGSTRLSYNPYDPHNGGVPPYSGNIGFNWYYYNSGRLVWGPTSETRVVPVDATEVDSPDAGDRAYWRAAMSFGFRLDPDVDPGLTSIKANNLVIYSPDTGPASGVEVDYYSGDEEQGQNAWMVLQDGELRTPAHRGMIYAVIGFTKEALANFKSEPVITGEFEDETFASTVEAGNFNFTLGFDIDRRISFGINIFTGWAIPTTPWYKVRYASGRVQKRLRKNVYIPNPNSTSLVGDGCCYDKRHDLIFLRESDGASISRSIILDGIDGSVVAASDFGPDLNAFYYGPGALAYGADGCTYHVILTTSPVGSGNTFQSFRYNPATGEHTFTSYVLSGTFKSPWARSLVAGPDPTGIYYAYTDTGNILRIAKLTPTLNAINFADAGVSYAIPSGNVAGFHVWGVFYRPSINGWVVCYKSDAHDGCVELSDRGTPLAADTLPTDTWRAALGDDLTFGGGGNMGGRWDTRVGDAILWSTAARTPNQRRKIDLETGAITTITITPPTGWTFDSGFTNSFNTTGGARDVSTAMSGSNITIEGEGQTVSLVPLSAMLRSVAGRCGFDEDKVVFEGFSDTLDVVQGVTFIGGIDPIDVFRNSAKIYGFDFFERGELLVFRKYGSSPTIDLEIDTADLVAGDEGHTSTRTLGEQSRPAVIELSYVDSTIQFQTSIARARSEVNDSAQVEREQTAFIMEASQANSLAGRMLLEAEAQSTTHGQLGTPLFLAAEPGDVTTFAVGLKGYTTKLEAVTINADLSVRFEHRNLLEERFDPTLDGDGNPVYEWTGYAGEAIPDVTIVRPPFIMSALTVYRGITFQPVTTHKGYTAPVAAGSRGITSVPISKARTYALTAAPASRTFQPIQTNISRGVTFVAAAAARNITSVPATLTYTPAPGTTTTLVFNSLDTSSTLSNTDRTATNPTANTYKNARVNGCFGPTEKVFFSIKYEAVGSGDNGIALATKFASLTTYFGVDGNSLSHHRDGRLIYGNSTVGSLLSYAVGDVMDYAVDYPNRVFWYRKNGGNWNNSGTADPATNTGGIAFPSGFPGVSGLTAAKASLFPAVQLNNGASPTGASMSVQQTATYGVPTGFTFLQPVTTGKRFWRFQITDNNGDTYGSGNKDVTLAEAEIRSTAGGADITSPTTAIWTDSDLNGFGWSIRQLFNNVTGSGATAGTGWASADKSTPFPINIWIDLGAAPTVAEFALTMRTDTAAASAPKAFTFASSVLGDTYTTEKTLTAETGWTLGSTRTYSIP
jgi:hypothetical protein